MDAEGISMRSQIVIAVVLLATQSPPNTQALRASFGPLQPVRSPTTDLRYALEIDRAARRFNVDPAWIRVVIACESAFDPAAVSPAGALGLMQVMPRTYATLARRHRLGADPFHPGDNIMAGAAYLREMHERFGDAGVFAAYNAGPGRYRDYLDTGRPLPLETRIYDRRVRSSLQRIGSESIQPTAILPDQHRGEAGDTALIAVRDRLFVDRDRARFALSPRPAASMTREASRCPLPLVAPPSSAWPGPGAFAFGAFRSAIDCGSSPDAVGDWSWETEKRKGSKIKAARCGRGWGKVFRFQTRAWDKSRFAPAPCRMGQAFA
jgi:hypothetical protein